MGRAHCGAHQTAKRKGHYAVQKDITPRNKKRRVRKHLRSNPSDAAWTPDLGLTERGKRLLKRAKQRFAA